MYTAHYGRKCIGSHCRVKVRKPQVFLRFNEKQSTKEVFSPEKGMGDRWHPGIRYLPHSTTKGSVRSGQILLSMRNPGCHPEGMKGRYSDVKILFLPPNTTSELQPLDLGNHSSLHNPLPLATALVVVAKIDSNNCASEIATSVTDFFWKKKMPRAN